VYFCGPGCGLDFSVRGVRMPQPQIFPDREIENDKLETDGQGYLEKGLENQGEQDYRQQEGTVGEIRPEPPSEDEDYLNRLDNKKAGSSRTLLFYCIPQA